jgi:CO/xanthine dehydrogenase Mo-binding subunit
MNAFPDSATFSRRAFFAAAGAVVVSFSLARVSNLFAQPAKDGSKLPGSLASTPLLDAWIRIGADNSITVCTGKGELGQGVKTALIQIAAEELGVQPATIKLVTADTRTTPDEGYTAGSNSMKDSGTAIQNAAAQVREILVARAADKFAVSADKLQTRDAFVLTDDGRRASFGDLVGDNVMHVRAQPQSKLKDPRTYAIVGKPFARVDIPAKVSGGVAYVQDVRLPGMVHARVVRPPSYGARLRDVKVAGAETLPGVIKVVRDGNFLAVVAEREFQAVVAMRALATNASWESRNRFPDAADIYNVLRRLPSDPIVDLDVKGQTAPPARRLEASYRRPYQMHGAIGPSCAIAQLKDETITVWTHSQGVYPLRKSLAELLRMPEDRVQCVHAEGAGCYGHNGADDVAADAALIARALPGRPIRVQWMREQEHAWEPYGPAMSVDLKAALDSEGKVVEWSHDVWTNAHSTRPGGAGNLLAAWSLEMPFAQPPPRPIPLPEGGGDRNAIPYYNFPTAQVVHHFIPAMPVRVSALRALGAYANVFAIESFIDELAGAAGIDSVEFRLRHLDDSRGRDVITDAATRFGWGTFPKAKGRGRGFAFARYKNLGAYLALAVDVEVERESGRVKVLRAVAAVDSGQPVNPDGIRNQIEGGIVQSASWTLYEAVSFDATAITSTDWSSYPIARFPDVPGSVDVHVIERPGAPFLGTGEAAQGPTAAALANAIANATGARLRELPLTRTKIKAAIGV